MMLLKVINRSFILILIVFLSLIKSNVSVSCPAYSTSAGSPISCTFTMTEFQQATVSGIIFDLIIFDIIIIIIF